MPIRGDSGQVLGLRPPHRSEQILLVEDSYLVIVGGVHTPGEEQHIDPVATVELLRCAASVLGPLKTVVGDWCGVRSRASGGLPLLGAVPGWRGLSIAVGHGSNGFLLAPVTAQAVCRQMQIGRLPSMAEACDPERRMGAAAGVVTRRAA